MGWNEISTPYKAPDVDLTPPAQYTLKGGERKNASAYTGYAPRAVAPSFNGRTDDSESSNRGSNPWGATKISLY